MRLELTKRWMQRLRALPKQGMGYQRVDVTLRSGQCVRDVIVFNAQEAQWPDERTPIEIADKQRGTSPHHDAREAVLRPEPQGRPGTIDVEIRRELRDIPTSALYHYLRAEGRLKEPGARLLTG